MKGILLLMGLFLSQLSAASQPELQVVKSFVTAYNQQDLESMLELTTSDVSWMSVESKKLSIITAGKEQLSKAMQGFFANSNHGRSEILSIQGSGDFVHTVEKAIWSSEGKEKSRCSVAIYELKELKILNVWYYPAHQCTE
ncbi:MAG: hypothetical protein CMP47_09245 [Rickettsiales bacterium]|jgi:ketosteroid isomerase-like protein|nr:hypothetical protein [Rickettsiales bacterium]